MNLSDLRRLAELEYGDIVVDSQMLSEKLRLFLFDTSFVDIWLSRRLPNRFGFHWERRHLDGSTTVCLAVEVACPRGHCGECNNPNGHGASS